MSEQIIVQYSLIACLGILLVVFTGIGILLLVKYGRDRNRVDATGSWASTNGQISASSLQENIDSWADGATTSTYEARIEYVYRVNGQEYRGNQVAVGGEGSRLSAGPAKALIGRYPAGRGVVIYYNPANPAQAVLERRASGGRTTLIMGIVMLLLAGCAICSFAYMLINVIFIKV